MSAVTFNVAKGSVVEKFRDGASNGIIILLSSSEDDNTLIDYATLEDLLSSPGNFELTDASYSRVTGVTGTITIDNTNDIVEISIGDQTFESLSGLPPSKAIVAYEDGASDSQRIPLTVHSLDVIADGSDIVLRFP